MIRYTFLPGQVDRYESPDDQRRRAAWAEKLAGLQGNTRQLTSEAQGINRVGALGTREQEIVEKLMAAGAQPGADDGRLLALLGVADPRAQPVSTKVHSTSPVGNFPPPQRQIVRGGG